MTFPVCVYNQPDQKQKWPLILKVYVNKTISFKIEMKGNIYIFSFFFWRKRLFVLEEGFGVVVGGFVLEGGMKKGGKRIA